MSVFADLASVHAIQIEEFKDGSAKIVLGGGDAGDSYTCAMRVEKGLIVSRRASDGEFPNNFFEETRYVNIRYKD
jgi:hypothetical protein